MRSVWRQTTRPKLGYSIAPREPLRSILSRQSTTRIPYRPVTFSDVFAVFLAPFLAAATIVNLSWKEKQKKDWDVKFNEIDKEIELLRQREVEAWSRLQLRSAKRGAHLQRRGYSTAAAPATWDIVEYEDDSTYENAVDGGVVAESSAIGERSQSQDTTSLFLSVDDPEPIITEKDMTAIRRFERLLALKLALHMMLHIQLGLNPGKHELYQPSWFPNNRLPGDVDRIVDQLQQVTGQLVKAFHPTTSISISTTYGPSREQMRLHDNISSLGSKLQNDEVTASEMVTGFAQCLLASSEPPTEATYAHLLKMFSMLRFEAFASMVYSALLETKTPLGDEVVYAMIEHLGRTRNVRAFDNFLREITIVNGRVNLQSPWQMEYVMHQSVPVPCAPKPQLLEKLVYAAVACGQIPRAYAWYVVMRHKGFDGMERMTALKYFLYYYAKQGNWSRGCNWILKSLRWAQRAVELKKVKLSELNTLFLRILVLCHACGKEVVYYTVLQELLSLGLDAPQGQISQKFTFPGSDEMASGAKHVRETWHDAYADRRRPSYLTSTEEKSMSLTRLHVLFVREGNEQKIQLPTTAQRAVEPEQTQLFKEQQAELEAARKEMTEYKFLQRQLQAQIDQQIDQIQILREQFSQAQDAAEEMAELQKKLEGMSQLEQDVGALRKLVNELMSQKSPSNVPQIDETKKLHPTVSRSVLSTPHALPEDDHPSQDTSTFDNGFFPGPSAFDTPSSGEEHSKNEAMDSASDSGYSSDASSSTSRQLNDDLSLQTQAKAQRSKASSLLRLQSRIRERRSRHEKEEAQLPRIRYKTKDFELKVWRPLQ